MGAYCAGALRRNGHVTHTKTPGCEAGRGQASGLSAEAYLILPSLNSTCLRTTGSYFFSTILSVLVRAFFLVT